MGNKSIARRAQVIQLGDARRVRARGTAKSRSPREHEHQRRFGVVIGRLVRVERGGKVVVDYPGNPNGRPLVARTTIRLSPGESTGSVTLMFENGDPTKPIITGRLQEIAASSLRAGTNGRIQAVLDDERVVLEAKREIELRCGKASLLLTAEGRVIIKGAYVLSRSSGPNKIKGATVHLN